MTVLQACRAKKIIVTALAVLTALAALALAGCGKVTASTTATPGTAVKAAVPAVARGAQLAKTYDMTFDNLTVSATSDGSLTSMSVNQAGRVLGYMTVDEPLSGTGSLSGTLNGSTITFTVGDGDYTGTVDDATRQISGTYTYPGQNGTWTAVPATGGAAGPAAGPVDCTGQNPSTCLLASNAVAGLDVGDDSDAPPGMHMENEEAEADGFAGAEFTDGQGNIIIANEDADLASPFGTATTYQNSSFLAEAGIYAGVRPAVLLSSAVQFAQKVAATSASARIYVTGFGLGGVEAEAQAQALGSQVTGGVTFGAPGLPGYQADGSQATVTNIVDYGDPVGNWASDPQSELADLAGKSIGHFGGVDLVGNPTTAALPRLAANAHNLMFSSGMEKLIPEGLPDNGLVEAELKLSPPLEGGNEVVDHYDLGLKLASFAYLAGGALLYHSLAQYASDLGVSLTPTVAPPTSMADYYREFDPTASTATLQSAAATTVNAGGAVSAPSYTLTVDTATDELATQTFNDQAGSQDVVTYDPDAQVSSLAVNDPSGTSYEISNDDAGQQAWSSRVYYYSGPDLTGTVTGVLYNWHTGGSQLTLFGGLPQGVGEEILDYSQPDATGVLISKSSS